MFAILFTSTKIPLGTENMMFHYIYKSLHLFIKNILTVEALYGFWPPANTITRQ